MIELTEEQRQAVLKGEPVRVPVAEIGVDVVVLRAGAYDRIQELLEDRALHEAWLDLTDEARREWAKENPY